MSPNPFLGVILHAIGGLASASFYVPYRKVKHWAWETYWLTGGVFSWIIAPWVLALLIVGPGVVSIITHQPAKVLMWTFLFGAMWGAGGLTFGLTMRYLGIALGMAIALGYCAAFGTLMPPIFSGKIVGVIHTNSGQVVLLGVLVCLIGIGISGLAGRSKEREMPEEQKKAAIKEFNFTKGLLVATFSGIMSAGMSYGFAAGQPICDKACALLHSRNPNLELFQNLPMLIVVLAGGFTTNFIWCMLLSVKNGTWRDHFTSRCVVDAKGERITCPSDEFARQDEMVGLDAIDNPSEAVAVGIAEKTGVAKEVGIPRLSNYVFSAIAGVTWYFQFFFYSMGTTKMGKYGFSSWTLHMSSIIIFSTLWGIALSEWKGASKRTHRLVAVGLAVLIGSTAVVGFGNFLGITPKLTIVASKHSVEWRRMESSIIAFKWEYRNKYQVEVANIDNQPEALKTYNVEKAPTFIFSNKRGKEESRHVGVYSEGEILAQFDRLAKQPDEK